MSGPGSGSWSDMPQFPDELVFRVIGSGAFAITPEESAGVYTDIGLPLLYASICGQVPASPDADAYWQGIFGMEHAAMLAAQFLVSAEQMNLGEAFLDVFEQCAQEVRAMRREQNGD